MVEAEFDAVVKDTEYKQALLDTLGFDRAEQDPDMLDVVLRARQDCESRAAKPAPLDGPVTDRAWGAVGEQPSGIALWLPAPFEARDQLWVKNAWQANLFRKMKDQNGQSSSRAQMREGQMFCNALLFVEMGVITLKLLKSAMEEIPADMCSVASPLTDMATKYFDTVYEVMREHADDHAYQLADPKAVVL